MPNGYFKDTWIGAGELLRFPNEDLRELGVRLVARVPEGRRSAKEALVVLALRDEYRLHSVLPASGERFRAVAAEGAGHLLADLLAPLADLPADAWTFDQIAYEVLAR